VLATTPVVVGWVAVVRDTGLPSDDLTVPALLTGTSLLLAVPALVAEWRRPRNPTSWLAVAVGAATVVGAWRLLQAPWLAAIGAATFLATPLAGPHLLLALPDGVDAARRSRVRWGCWLVPSALAALMLLGSASVRPATWAATRPGGGWSPQHNPIARWDADLVVRLAWAAWAAWIVGVACGVSLDRARRARAARGDRDLARFLLPLSLLETAAVVATAVAASPSALDHGRHVLERWYGELIVVAPAIAAAALGAALAWSELFRPRLTLAPDGTIQLDAVLSPAAAERRLGRYLADPSARLLFPAADGAWLDQHGRTSSLAAADRRAATVITSGGEPIAAVEHDEWLLTQPDLLDVVVTSLARTIDSQRLAAIAVASTDDVQRSATRLLDAGERARRQVEAQLADGPDRTLAEVGSLLVARPVPMGEVHAGLRKAAADLREVAHGIAPHHVLAEGLPTALAELVASARHAVELRTSGSDRVPATLALTVYIVAAAAVGASEDPIVLDLEVDAEEVRLRVGGWFGPVDPVVRDRLESLEGTVTPVVDGVVVAVPLPDSDR
jgi:hypothetical protein